MKNITHELKADPEYFNQVWRQNKNFECRLNDRNFKEGHIVVLRETDKKRTFYTGRYVFAKIGFVLNDSFCGIKDGFCMFSLLNPTFDTNGDTNKIKS